ncbi:MAG: hypothetical protein ACI9ON_003115 [Limisphaerales bacterium]
MKSELLNTWLSVAANFGVVVGLGILIFEVNQSTRVATADANLNRADSISQALVEYAVSDDLAQIDVKAAEQGLESLTSVERSRLVMWESAKILRVESQYLQFEQGLLGEDFYENGFVDVVQQSLPRWKGLGLLISTGSSFRKVVEEIDAEHGLR